MKIIVKILWFALFFGVGDLIGEALQDDYDGVGVAAVVVTIIAALILAIEIIIQTRGRHDTSK